jgi:hypothetical protein
VKLLVAGFDGLSCPIFERTELSALRQLREEAQWGTLRSAEMETGASWTTILTGWPVETHGLRGFMGASSFNRVYFHNRPHDYIFDELATAGYTVGVVNFPTMDVPRAIGGESWMIGGWPYEPRAYPGTLQLPADYYTDIADYGKRGVPEREPDVAHHHCWWPQQVMDAEEYFAFVCANQQKRIEVAAAAPPVDVLMLQCNVMDRAGHLLSYCPGYDGLGASHPAYEQFVQIVEWSVEELQQRFEPEFFALVSDHGFAGRGHSPEGVWALRGPDVLPLRFDAEQESFTPTVLDALGITVVRQGISVLHRRSEQAAQADTLKALGYL